MKYIKLSALFDTYLYISYCYKMPDASTQTTKTRRGPKIGGNKEIKIKKNIKNIKNKIKIKQYDTTDIKTIIMFDDV